ncbi:IS110 family transposase [Brevundimonas sp.]|uniref:IS110 family transposase n=1 Tax=Brevundimonas sp. TaxID=1871086 RepID=UPI002D4F677C|nr:IS110 family transposase [Brevundimonas sp.]HYD26881.1 IS110 family transposase [Brevundimonas sp.]
MDHIGIDVHKKDSQLCILTSGGEAIEVRVPTRLDRLAEVLAGRPRSRVLLEASTESEWVARHVESLGHEVVVADPNYAPMYGMRTRRVKTDRRDARALAEASRSGTYRVVHRRSDAQRAVNVRLTMRDALVRTRTRYIAVIRSSLRAHGLRMPAGGDAESFAERLASMDLPTGVRDEVSVLAGLLEPINAQITACESVIKAMTKQDATVRRLQTAPGVGLIVATAFRAIIDDPNRFRDAQQVPAYLGLVPSEASSGEKPRKGRITKTGNGRMRWLLVQSAHGILRSRTPESLRLREWAGRIQRKRGRKVATVALARKLAGILYAMMRDGTEFAAHQSCEGPSRQAAA